MASENKTLLIRILGVIAVVLSSLQLLFFINQLLLGLKLDIPDAVLIIAFVGIIVAALVMLVHSIVSIIRGTKAGLVLLLGSLSLFCFEIIYFIMMRGALSEKLLGSQIVIPFGLALILAAVFFISGLASVIMGLRKRHDQLGYWGLFTGSAAIAQLLFFIIMFIPMLSALGGGQTGNKILEGCAANQQALSEGMKLYMEMEYLPAHPAASPQEIEQAAKAIDLSFDGFKVNIGGKEIHYGSSKEETFRCPGNKKSDGHDYRVVSYTPATDGKLGTFKVECKHDEKHNQQVKAQ